MAIDIDYYKKIQNMYGSTDTRTAKKFEIQRNLSRDFNKTLDAYTVEIDGVEQNLTILKTDNLHIKKLKSKPNEVFYIGQYVEWHNSHWLITEVDTNNDIITYGNMEECNYLLKWQNENGTIVERWGIVKSASKYNDGTNVNNYIIDGSDQLSVAVSVDSETIKLKKDMKKRFFIDGNTTNPTTYKLTGTSNVEGAYNGHGITAWIVKECAYTATADDIFHGVCEYFTPSEDDDDDTDSWYMKIDCRNYSIKANSTKIYTAQLYDEYGEELTEYTDGSPISYSWNVVSEISDYLTYSANDNTLTLTLSSDYEDFGDEITISCASTYTGQSDSINLTTKEVF